MWKEERVNLLLAHPVSRDADGLLQEDNEMPYTTFHDFILLFIKKKGIGFIHCIVYSWFLCQHACTAC